MTSAPAEAHMTIAPAQAHMTTAPPEVERPDTDVEFEQAVDGETERQSSRPWVTIVWDDPVNLMDYVTHVFQKVFGYPKKKAERLMLQVHQEGRAVVSAGTREQMENDVQRLHAHGLWATLQKDD